LDLQLSKISVRFRQSCDSFTASTKEKGEGER